MRWVRLVIVVALVVAAVGCSRPAKMDDRFEVNHWLLATIRGADRVTLYEGLPHSRFESDLLDRERKSKPTVELHGFPFYDRPAHLTDADRAAMVALLGDDGSFAQRPDATKMCGGFHPDSAVEWAVGGEVYYCLLCFGCGEAKVYGPGAALYCDIVARDALKRLLRPYWKDRPASEIWPPAIAAELGGAPDRGGTK